MNLRPLLAGLLWLSVVASAWPQPPAFPPGVKLIAHPPGEDHVPVGVSVSVIEVDWTNALLRPRIATGLDARREFPLPWNAVAGDSLAIQLSEPVNDNAAWRLSNEVESPRPPRRSPRMTGSHVIDPEPPPSATDGRSEDGRRVPPQVRIGGINPWFFAGGPAETDFEPVSPLGDGSSRVNVQWLGRVDDWIASPPGLLVDPFLLLSTLDQATGRAWFMMIVNRTDRPMPCGFLTPWLASSFAPDLWIAIHTTGGQSRVGVGEWRLGDTNGARSPVTLRGERAGAVLILEGVRPDEPVDWMRAGKVEISASSSRNGYPAGVLQSGRLWPSTMQPPVWEVQPPTSGGRRLEDIESWLLCAPRSSVGGIDTIRLIHPSAVGWSKEFDAPGIAVDLQLRNEGRFSETLEITGHGPVTTIRFAEPRRLSRVRLRMKGMARLSAIQLVGPQKDR